MILMMKEIIRRILVCCSLITINDTNDYSNNKKNTGLLIMFDMWNDFNTNINICSISITWPPCGRGTVVSIISCPRTYCCRETSHGKITRHYSRYSTVTFGYVHKCELSYMCPDHDIKLYPHRVKLYRTGCVGSGLVLAKALM